MKVIFSPSKVLGKNTKIVWSDIHNELINLQFLETKKYKMTSKYINKKGEVVIEHYTSKPFEDMLTLRTDKNDIISDRIKLNIFDDSIEEETAGKKSKKYISLDMAFMYTNSLNPYIDSFSNGNNTIDNGSHLEGVLEAICRYFQTTTKNSLSERDNLDIKWDDVKSGLALIVSLNTNLEELYTSQTKHKVSNDELEKIIKDKTMIALSEYFDSSQSKCKELINIVKTNAKARREGEKAKNSVVKESMTNWSSFKMRNYTPCINKGKEYKELYICEGLSAKGTLAVARDPKTQAIFSVRGVSLNVQSLDLEKILENKEFNDLIKIMGCNVGLKFDISKLSFNKICIASDADTDGLFIRALLCTFFFKLYPEIILDNRLFIAEPPLYKVTDKTNPFVVNRNDYVERYANAVVKEYKIGYKTNDEIEYISRDSLFKLLTDTSDYVDNILQLSQHYKINDRLVELIVEELVDHDRKDINIDKFIKRVNEEFPEVYFDEKDRVLKGIIDGKYQLFELSDRFIRKSKPLIPLIKEYAPSRNQSLVLKHNKTGSELDLSLLGALKVLKKFQPEITVRMKGLGEATKEDIRTTIMDPNTRTLIRVQISDIENDMKVFQMLRGNSAIDRQNRKEMMRNFDFDVSLIDT